MVRGNSPQCAGVVAIAMSRLRRQLPRTHRESIPTKHFIAIINTVSSYRQVIVHKTDTINELTEFEGTDLGVPV